MIAVTSPNLSTSFLYIILLKQTFLWLPWWTGQIQSPSTFTGIFLQDHVIDQDKWTSIFRLKKSANCPSNKCWKPWFKVTLNIPLLSPHLTQYPEFSAKTRLTWHKFQGPEEMIWQGKLLKITEACEFEAKKGKYSSHTASSFKN